jgi:hypothetical protein
MIRVCIADDQALTRRRSTATFAPSPRLAYSIKMTMASSFDTAPSTSTFLFAPGRLVALTEARSQGPCLSLTN